MRKTNCLQANHLFYLYNGGFLVVINCLQWRKHELGAEGDVGVAWGEIMEGFLLLGSLLGD